MGELQATPATAVLGEAGSRVSWLRCIGATSLEDGRIGARYAFAHTMYRPVLYERLLPPHRLLLHREWAAALAAPRGSRSGELATELALHFERGDMPAAAAGQLALAAAGALARGAGSEALRAARHGLQLGQHAIDPPLEFELCVLEAVALTRLHVVSEPAAAAAFKRAITLGATKSPSWPLALHGSWWVCFLRGEVASARSRAAEMLALAERRDDAALRLTGSSAMGLTLMMAGESPGAPTSASRCGSERARGPCRYAAAHPVRSGSRR